MKTIVKTYYYLDPEDVELLMDKLYPKGIYSLRQLAKKINLSPSFVSAVFNGKKSYNEIFQYRLKLIGVVLDINKNVAMSQQK